MHGYYCSRAMPVTSMVERGDDLQAEYSAGTSDRSHRSRACQDQAAALVGQVQYGEDQVSERQIYCDLYRYR
jgi:hypothetical protein